MYQQLKEILREELSIGPMQTAEQRIYNKLEKYMLDNHGKMGRIILAAERITSCCLVCTRCASCEMAAALKEPK